VFAEDTRAGRPGIVMLPVGVLSICMIKPNIQFITLLYTLLGLIAYKIKIVSKLEYIASDIHVAVILLRALPLPPFFYF
jgi:hypothetical protein